MQLIKYWPLLFWINTGIYTLLVIISISHGFQYKFAGDSLALYFNIMAFQYFLVLIFLTISCFWFWHSGSINYSLDYIGLMMMSLSFFMTCYFYSYKLSDISWITITVPVIIVAMISQIKWGARASTIVFSFFGIVLYSFFIANVPHTEGANMLELIEAVARDYFAGTNPYNQDYLSTVANKFGYLPALWMPYSIAYESGLDVRIINILCLSAIIFLFEWILTDCPKKSQIMSVTLYPIALAPPVAQMIIHGHVLPYWLYLVLTAIALHKNRLVLASVAFGFALASRQPSVFLAPLFATYVFLNVKFGEFLKYLAVTLIAYALIVIPFAIWTGNEFWVQTYFTASSMESRDFLIYQINGSGFLYSIDLKNALKYIQIFILLAGMGAVIKYREKGPIWSLYFSALIYIWLVFFNIYVARYIYMPAIILMSFTVAIAMSREGNHTTLIQRS